MLSEPLMAESDASEVNAEEKVSLKLRDAPGPANPPSQAQPRPSPPRRQPSLTRRMSSQLLFQAERQRSIADNIGITERVNQLLPNSITQNIPGLAKAPSANRLTFHCNICFERVPVTDGFTLSACQHQFFRDCFAGFLKNKISNGQVNISCFYPCDEGQPCGERVSEDDIRMCVDGETWAKFERFKANQENARNRQCPYCDHTDA